MKENKSADKSKKGEHLPHQKLIGTDPPPPTFPPPPHPLPRRRNLKRGDMFVWTKCTGSNNHENKKKLLHMNGESHLWALFLALKTQCGCKGTFLYTPHTWQEPSVVLRWCIDLYTTSTFSTCIARNVGTPPQLLLCAHQVLPVYHLKNSTCITNA